MEAGLETGDAAQLSSAMNRAEAWLANHGTSKVFLAANTEVRLRPPGQLTNVSADKYVQLAN